MSEHPLTVLIAVGLPICILLAGAVILFAKGKSVSSLLQVIGAGGLMMVVLAHIAELFHLLPWMGWGAEHSAGHYLDLASAVLGLTFLPAGYFLHSVTWRPTRQLR
jgi:hypothetical protein